MKNIFFKKIFISKFFQKSLIGGDFDFLDEFDNVWDPKKHQKSFFTNFAQNHQKLPFEAT